MTNFDSRIQCTHDNQYKFGALCYRQCDSIGNGKTPMVNCGILGCATDWTTCATAIINMVMEIGFSISSLAALSASAGTAAPAVVAGRQLLRRSNAMMVKVVARGSAISTLKVTAKAFAKKAVKKMAKGAKHVAKQLGDAWTENAVKNLCHEYGKTYHNAIKADFKGFDPKMLDLTGTAAAIDSCGGENARTQPWTCAGAITSALSTLDPTGLLGVASAFMHDKCG